MLQAVADAGGEAQLGIRRALVASARHLSACVAPNRPLRVPSRAVRGGPSDVKHVLPLLAALSDGACQGTPRWVEKQQTPSNTMARKRSASWLEISYPFSTDAQMRDLYMLSDGRSLRAGRFLEELDAFSADCAFRHADGFRPERRLTVVTAAHDGLSVFGALSAHHDLRLRGAVVAVGSTSMEVQTDLLRVDASAADGEVYMGSCYTVMVARDATTFDKATVPPLRGGDERSDLDRAESARRQMQRRTLAATALAKMPPTPEEVPLLHELWRTRDAAGSASGAPSEPPASTGRIPIRIPMLTTEQRALDTMQPNHRPQSSPAKDPHFSANTRCARHHAAESS